MKSTTKKQRKNQECHFGYAIVREKDDKGIIISTNINHKKFQKGNDFWSAIKIPAQERALIRTSCVDGGSYLIFSGMGVGILSALYEAWGGYRLYFHLDSNPSVVQKTLSRMKHTLPFWQQVLEREKIAPADAEEITNVEFDADLALKLVHIETLLQEDKLLCEERAEKGITPCEFIRIMGELLDCKINLQYTDKNPHEGKYHTLYAGLHRSMIVLLLAYMRETFGTSDIIVTVVEDETDRYHLTMKTFTKIPSEQAERTVKGTFRHDCAWFLRRIELFGATVSCHDRSLSETEEDLLMREWKNPDEYCAVELCAEISSAPSATPPGILKAKPALIMDDES